MGLCALLASPFNVLQARELRRRIRRNPEDIRAQQQLSQLLQRCSTDAKIGPTRGGATGDSDVGVALGLIPAVISGDAASAGIQKGLLASTAVTSSSLHPDLQKFESATPVPNALDESQLTTILSREIQATFKISNEEVSKTLASRAVKSGWWCGETSRVSTQRSRPFYSLRNSDFVV